MKVYLGDGAYAEFDGIGVVVSAERMGGTHYVSLGEDEIDSLFRFIERVFRVKIRVEKESEE